MADNPFDPKNNSLLAALGVAPRRNALTDLIDAAPPATPYSYLDPSTSGTPAGMFGSLAGVGRPAPTLLGGLLTDPPKPAPSPFGSAFGGLGGPAPTFLGGLLDVLQPPPSPLAPYSSPLYAPPTSKPAAPRPSTPYSSPLYAPPKPKPVAPSTVRRAFFSFQFDDIMRVNNVRNAWKIDHPDSADNRSFRDSSLWESRKVESPDVIKNLIRSGVLYTSAVCVLAGSMTWDRRWVRYEIARAIIDGRGLLTVHLNNLKHHRTKSVHPRGLNPLAHMGIAKLQRGLGSAEYFLYEMWFEPDGHCGLSKNWQPYSDYTQAVKKPAWLRDPDVGYVMPLSADAAEYDYVLDSGHRNIGAWIDKAAKQAGR
jgi:MTH538 TIR-like domain (DUF1863)